ncbi:protein of unknown function [Methylocella tundrae]|uniref:Uncharacterized protein n=1 Tax=Methylocella tundrae TaxID=227605 RepID=A0A4U8Z4T1_METTU|nr:protein of unknown function [Methylocella tundrae]
MLSWYQTLNLYKQVLKFGTVAIRQNK